MNEKTKTGLEILEAAVLLGILGDVLLRETPWGLNVFLWIGALVAAMIMLTLRRRSELFSSQTIALQVALVFFAAMFVWRDSIELKLLNSLAILTILSLLTLPALEIKAKTAGVFQYAFSVFWSGINAAFAPAYLVFVDVKWKTLPQKGWTKHLTAVFRGLAIAAPILLIFGALFMAADAIFQGIVEQTFRINPEILFTHIFLIGLFSWIVSGYLRGSLLGNFAPETPKVESAAKTQTLSVTEIKDEKADEKEAKAPEKTKTWDWRNFDNSVLPKSFTLGAIETSIVLGLMNLLFLGFVIVQIPYLFGGMDLVQNTPDFKLAEYARRGFGELVTVAALVLPILLGSHWLLRKDSPINEKIYRALAGIQIVLLFVIMISATQRLLLLTGNLGYGLTTIRLYPMVFMIWLALVFVWFALTVLRNAREQFAWGALWSAFFVLGTLHVLNPDDFIVRTNVRLLREGRAFDSFYASELSDDAVPALLENLPAMSFEQQCVIKNKISHRFNQVQAENDFRTWNWSRSAARNAMETHGESFDTSTCPPQTYRFDNYSD
jgi:MFS family permease